MSAQPRFTIHRKDGTLVHADVRLPHPDSVPMGSVARLLEGALVLVTAPCIVREWVPCDDDPDEPQPGALVGALWVRKRTALRIRREGPISFHAPKRRVVVRLA